MSQPDYFTKYANFALARDDKGVLIVRLHTDDGPLVFGGQTLRDFSELLEELTLDLENKAMVLTGTGDAFINDMDGASLGEIHKPTFYQQHLRQAGIRVEQRLLDIPIPVVGVANGPATVHSEYLLLCDIHIASELATYGDFAHPTFSVACGDGVHVVWEEVVGSARARWLLWTGESIDARTALAWGVVAEVVPHPRALERGVEIARSLAGKPALYKSLQKEVLNLNLRRRITSDVPVGQIYEALTAADAPYQTGDTR
jgi:enoyl-CoA hydratase/carnithine racemase